MQKDFKDLRNGVVLAELGGHGDGPYCAKHGAGAALVMLGTYIVDPGDSVPYPKHFVFKPGQSSFFGYLEEHIAAARASATPNVPQPTPAARRRACPLRRDTQQAPPGARSRPPPSVGHLRAC